MNVRKKTVAFLFLITGLLLLATVAVASTLPAVTAVEHVYRRGPGGPGDALGTISYTPSRQEQPFFNRLAADEVATGSLADDYDISAKDRVYVGWFGIVRVIAEDRTADRTLVTVEHKYFDALTDAHIQAVSFNGGGDFQVVLAGTGYRIPPLSLVQVYAIRALGDIGPRAKPATAALKSLLTDEDQGFRVLVAETLWRIDQQPDDVIPVFISALEHGDEDTRYEAAEELKAMGPWAAPAVPALLRALKDTSWANRCAVAEAMGEIGPAAASAIPALTNTIQHDEKPDVQGYATEALGKIGDPAAIPVLIAALTSDNDFVRSRAMEALEEFGHAAKAAVPALMQAVKSDESNACTLFATMALGSVDADGVSTPVLIEALGNENATTRRFAAYALGCLGEKAGAAEQALRDRLTDSDPGARIAAAQAYWSVSGKADEAVSVVRSALQVAIDGPTRIAAIDALEKIGPAAKTAVPDLIPCLDGNFHTAVTSAADALAKIGPDALPAVPALTNMLEHSEYDEVRACAARALWYINGCERALPVLQDVLRNSSHDWGLTKAARAVGEMGPQAVECVPLLQPLLKHNESFVRDAAKEALRQIEPHGSEAPKADAPLGNGR